MYFNDKYGLPIEPSDKDETQLVDWKGDNLYEQDEVFITDFNELVLIDDLKEYAYDNFQVSTVIDIIDNLKQYERGNVNNG